MKNNLLLFLRYYKSKMKSLQLAIYLAIRYNEPEIVNILIKEINVNIPLDTGTTLLDEAIRYRRATIVKYLLLAGAVKTIHTIAFWLSILTEDVKQNNYTEEHAMIQDLFYKSVNPAQFSYVSSPYRSISLP